MHSKRFQYRIGDSFSQSVNLKTDAGAAYDLTGATLWYVVKENEDDADEDAKLWLYWEDGGTADGIAVADALSGTAQVSRTAVQMNDAAFLPGVYFWFLRLKVASSAIYSPDVGILDVLPGITAITPP